MVFPKKRHVSLTPTGKSACLTHVIRFYNELRYQKRLNGLSPLEFRAQAV
ncbi:IS3 family transposase [Exiguobacterium sp. N4-1P]